VGGSTAEADAGAGGSADGIPSVNPLTGTPYSRRYREIYEQRKKLPVWQFLDQFQKLVSENQVIVVEGETGSGKTTQVGGCRRRQHQILASHNGEHQQPLPSLVPASLCRSPSFSCTAALARAPTGRSA